jgi:hypothetical protein
MNNPVLNLEHLDHHCKFKKGYPDRMNNNETNGIRIQNREKRAASWDRFISELKKEGRYNE